MKVSYLVSRQGFSLVEVMVAMTILVVGIMTLMGAMSTSNEVKNRAISQGLALEAVQAQIEKLQAMSFTQAAGAVPRAPSGIAFPVSGLVLRPEDGAAGSISLQTDSTGNLLHFTFSVNWVDVQGPVSYSVDLYLTNRGS